jgi:hypothetical protein
MALTLGVFSPFSAQIRVEKLAELVKEIREFRKYVDQPLTLRGSEYFRNKLRSSEIGPFQRSVFFYKLPARIAKT